MNFLCPACRTPLPKTAGEGIVPCTRCGVQVDLTRLDTAPGIARLWPDLDLAGETLGAYKLTRRLAAGGMGVVYEAEGPQGPCAVKVLSALLAAEPELRTRFRREAAALRAIEHPGVVRIFAEGEERGFSWYAMERVHGPDLRTRIAQGALPAAEVEALARRLLETLATVHEKGFVHRDLKPGNILLAEGGPKLCDFGIARFDGSSTLTESAAVLGSLRYMAPEQRLGRTDARSDLYALGVVLHEALCKGVPGEASLPRILPPRLRRLLARLLAERPVDRPASARMALVEMDRRPKGPIALGLGSAAALCVAFWFALGVVPPVLPSAPQAKAGEPQAAQAELPKVKAKDTAAAAPQVKEAAQAAREPEVRGQALQRKDDLPQEVLGNVGLAPEQNAANAAPNDLTRGLPTRQAASPVKPVTQAPKELEGETLAKGTKIATRLANESNPEINAKLLTSVLYRNSGALQACGEKYPEASGTLTMGLTVLPSGEVGEVRTLSEEFQGTGVARCMTGMLGGLRFPAFKGDKVDLQLPVKLAGAKAANAAVTKKMSKLELLKAQDDAAAQQGAPAGATTAPQVPVKTEPAPTEPPAPKAKKPRPTKGKAAPDGSGSLGTGSSSAR